ncbi:MAG TPA: prepilin peptidase [Candidatus Sumerlaeota bacterium]|nr:prepilin peptidase [Candidatus Sumerlaeota bacterium]
MPDNIFSPEYFYAHLPFVALLGLLFGSFLNVCIYRIPAGLSIVVPGSHCFSCGVPIRWYDNIPVFSYLWLQGRCRFCGTTFSARYLFVEVLTGIFFGLTFRQFQYTLATPVYIVFACLLIVATFTDLDHWIIPDGVTIGGAVFGLLAAVVAGFFPKGFLIAGSWPFPGAFVYAPFLNALAGALSGAALLYGIGVIGTYVFKKEAMGFGDVKLFLLVGSFLGPLNCMYVITIASLIGSVSGGALILVSKISARRARRSRHDVVPSEPAETPCDQLDSPPCDARKDESLPESPQEREARIVGALRKSLTASHDGQAPQRSAPIHHIPFGPFIAAGALVILYLRPVLARLIERIYGF